MSNENDDNVPDSEPVSGRMQRLVRSVIAECRELQEGEEVREGDFWKAQWGFVRFDHTPKEGLFRIPRRYKRSRHAKTYRAYLIEGAYS